MTGLNQSIHYRPGTCAIYESTANGVGNWFHDQWQAATQHESVFTRSEEHTSELQSQ